MSGWFQDLLQGFAGGLTSNDFLRDYTHASKTFTPNFYQNTPKYKFLFHTYFDINPEIYNAGIDSRQNYGILVKEVKLPTYTFNTSQLNQYNRKRIVQTKIKYEPVTITFHDDNGNQITKMWEAYYLYNYRDGTKALGNRINTIAPGEEGVGVRANDDSFGPRNIYQTDIMGENWGFSGDAYNNSNAKVPFFKNITVFGLNRHNFVAYRLINPVITNFTHDTYNYEQGNGLMTNQMTIDYETVVYDYGAIDGTNPGNIVTGFGSEENYDRRLSPIAIPGSNRTILGQGGLIDGFGGVVENLNNGNLLGAAITGYRTYNTFKDVDIKQTAKQELLNGAASALTNPNTIRNVVSFIPKLGSTASTTGTAGAPPSEFVGPPQISGNASAGGE